MHWTLFLPGRFCTDRASLLPLAPSRENHGFAPDRTCLDMPSMECLRQTCQTPGFPYQISNYDKSSHFAFLLCRGLGVCIPRGSSDLSVTVVRSIEVRSNAIILFPISKEASVIPSCRPEPMSQVIRSCSDLLTRLQHLGCRLSERPPTLWFPAFLSCFSSTIDVWLKNSTACCLRACSLAALTCLLPQMSCQQIHAQRSCWIRQPRLIDIYLAKTGNRRTSDGTCSFFSVMSVFAADIAAK